MSAAGAPPQLSPWRALWFRPRSAIDAILSQNRSGLALGIFVLGTILGALGQLNLNAGRFDDVLAGANIRAAALVALAMGVWAVPFYFVGGWVLNAIARAIGGQGTAAATRIAWAWSSLPLATACALSLALTLVAAALSGTPVRGSLTGVLLAAGSLWCVVLATAMLARVQRFGWLRAFTSLLIGFLALLAIPILVRSLAFQPFSIPSGAMTPTLLPGDCVFTSKSAYGFGKYSFPFGLSSGIDGRILGRAPKRGDVVVFRTKDGSDFVKRIIGLPGEKIQMRKGRIFIDGKIVERRAVEPGLKSRDPSGKSVVVTTYDETLPDAPVHRIIQIYGDDGLLSNTQEFETPPGAYFVMGDNRDNSSDSRLGSFGVVGFVPLENLIGKVEVIYYSAGENEAGRGSHPRPERIGQWVE